MTTFNFNTLCAGRSLTTEESQALFTQVFEGKIDPALLAGILTALKIKGETPEEIEGAARAMVAAAAHFPRPRGVEVGEIVGTGGDGMKTINVSTTTALLAAAAGLKIAKHGNRGVSSPTGASDLLTALGVDIRLTPDGKRTTARRHGILLLLCTALPSGHAFCRSCARCFKNPHDLQHSGAAHQSRSPRLCADRRLFSRSSRAAAQTLRLLGVKRAYVVHGSGLDEAAVHGTTEIAGSGRKTARSSAARSHRPTSGQSASIPLKKSKAAPLQTTPSLRKRSWRVRVQKHSKPS